MPNLTNTLLAIALVFSMLSPAVGQQVTEQRLIWLRYYNKWNISEKLQIHSEIEERRYFLPDRIHQRFLPRVGLQYNASNRISFNIGAVHFQQYNPQDPRLEGELFIEWRPHQFVAFTENYGKWKVKTRAMLEQRWIENEGFGERTFRFNLRPRALFRVDYPLSQGWPNEEFSKLTVFVFDEIFVQMGEGVATNVFDQNRLGGGFNFVLNPYLGFEIDYFNWYQQLPTGSVFVSRHIFQFTLFHTI